MAPSSGWRGYSTDFQNQRRNVIEQRVRGKHAARIDGQQVEQALEPPRRERTVLDTHPFSDEIAEVRDDHDRGVNN